MFASKDLFFSKPSGYQISRSLRFRQSATAYLNRTYATPTSTTIGTISFWYKRGLVGNSDLVTAFGTVSTTTGNGPYLQFTTNGALRFVDQSSDVITSAFYRDPAAWYHFVLAIDTTQATAANRLKFYVNGVQITSFSSATYGAQNYASNILAAGTQYIGYSQPSNARGSDGYMAEVNFIDGQALTPSSFGQTNTITGVWQPLKYTGTYGTNGFYLNFSDNSNNTATTIGKDYSGNGNNWTPNNISVTAGVTYDSMLDVPTLFADGGNGRGNYCTLNPANNTYSTGSGPKFFTLTNGNLTGTTSAGGGGSRVMGTVGVSSGKWYAEATIGAASINASAEQGLICVPVLYQASSIGGSGGSGGVVYVAGTGQKRTDASGSSAYGSTYTTGDVIGVALDMDSGTVTFYKNNVSQGVALSGLTGSYTIGAQANDVTSNANYATYDFNFGQRPFTYTPPTGFVALNTQNLPTPTISNGANYMAATTYTGNGTSLAVSNAVNGISFAPDFVWVKSRPQARSHRLLDTIRGVGNTLFSDQTAAETVNANGVTAFNSNGFTVGTDINYNNSAEAYIGWQWNAGGSTVTNTSGSISAQVRANPTAGFSVLTFTGTGAVGTIGHGLGVAPSMIIVKNRPTAGTSWVTYHASVGATKYLLLNTTDAATVGSAQWNNTAPTSTVFTMGNTSANTSGQSSVAYCFAEVAGYSKFGSYTGNGSADGPFVFCGFRPRFIMVKRTDAVDNWFIHDTSRDTYNASASELYPNLSNAENAGGYPFDLLSNGFKVRTAGTGVNASAGTYIFAAFAENPTKFSLAR